MEADNAARSGIGIVCSLAELPTGRLRLVIDDVTNDRQSISGAWSHRVLFTWKDFDAPVIDNLDLCADELAAFGYSILARLVAYRKHPVQ